MIRKENTKLYIDVGSWATKIVEAGVKHDEINIVNYDMIKTPDGIFSCGLISKENTFSEVLEKGIKDAGFRSKTAVLTIADMGILVREVLLPKSSLKDLAVMVNLEAPRHFPVDISKYTIDFKVLGQTTENDTEQYKVIILATPDDVITSYLKAFEKCNIHLERIDYKPNSIAKLLKRYDEIGSISTPGTYAVIDIGYGCSNITICQDGLIHYGRTFPHGTRQYNEELVNILGCTAEEAEAIKLKIGAFTCEGECSIHEGAARQAWEKLSIPFFGEVTKVFSFFTSRDTNNNIDRILITGGSSLMPQLSTYMQKFFNSEIGFLSCERVVNFQDFGVDIKKFSSYYSNCVGSIFDRS